jgi:transcriptional regulator with XRE-family HTH domain
VNQIALTPLQLRAARKLLRWSRDRLAVRIGVSFMTVARFENEGWLSSVFDPQKAREVLEAVGVEFVSENGGEASVKLRKAPG